MRKAVTTLLFLTFCGFSAHAEWIKQSTNSFAWFRDVFFLNQDKGWIAGTEGTVLTTEDGGKTWKSVRKFTTDSILQIHFLDENNGWMLCERNVYSRGNNPTAYVRKTTDGGKNWEKIELENAGRERVTRMLFNKSGGATAFGEGGIFYKLQEDGVTWKKSITAVHFVLLDGSYGDVSIGAISGAGGTIMFTENGGLSWEKATIIGNTDAKINGIFFADPRQAWAVGSNGAIFHAAGGGRLWKQQYSGTNVNLTDVYFTDTMSGWAVGENGTILSTRDGGTSWAAVNSRITHKIERLFFVGKKGYAVGFGGTLLEYDDASAASPAEKPKINDRN